MQRIISSGLVSYERLPMLEIVFDRLVRIMSTSLRNFTSDNVEVGIDNIVSLRFGDYLNSIPLPAMLAVFKAEEWDNYGLMVIDSAMIYSIVDVLLGGRRGTAAMRIEGRPYTTIERTLVERLVARRAGRPGGELRPAMPGDVPVRAAGGEPALRHHLPPVERGGRWSGCASTWRTAAAGSSCCCPTRRWSRCASCCCSSSWASDSAATASGRPIWPRSCGTPTSTSTSVLDEQMMPLSDVMKLEVGSRIMLGAGPGGSVQLRCGAVTLFDGRVGRKKDRVAVRIEETLVRAPFLQPAEQV